MKLSKFSFVMVGVLMMFKPVYAANHTIEFHTQNNTVNCSNDSEKQQAINQLERNNMRPNTVTINQGSLINIYTAQDIDFSAVIY